eukprot:496866_1
MMMHYCCVILLWWHMVYIPIHGQAPPVPDQWEIPGVNDPDPTPQPTFKPTIKPSNMPSVAPSAKPTASPSDNPSIIPSISPSNFPTSSPSRKPTASPSTWAPTKPDETRSPSTIPTISPSKFPTVPPTFNPSLTPTKTPSKQPTTSPVYIISTTNNDAQQDEQTTSDSHDSEPMTDKQSTTEPMDLISCATLPTQALSLVVVLVLFIGTVYRFNLCCTKSNNKHTSIDIVTSIKVPVLLAFLCNIGGIGCCCYISYVLNTADAYDRQTYERLEAAYYPLIGVYCLGKFCLETFFLMRVQMAFKDSTFELHRSTVIVLSVWMLCVSGFWCYLFAADDQSIFGANFALFLVLEGVEASLIITLLYLFIVRLYRLILQQRSDAHAVEAKHGVVPSSSVTCTASRSQSNHADVSTSNITIHKVVTQNNTNKSWRKPVKRVKFTPTQTNLIFVITRCILLSAMSLFTTAGFTLFVFYFVKWRAVNMLVLYALWSVDMATNCICLFLNFRFADGIYKKSCGVCHSGCQKAMEYRTAKTMMNNALVSQSNE